jgi:hypothetical protein
MFTFASSLIHLFNSEYLLVDLVVVPSNADHCVVRFLPDASLVSILMERFVFVIPLIIDHLAALGADRLAALDARRPSFLLDDVGLCWRTSVANRIGPEQRLVRLLVRFISASPRERRRLAAEGKAFAEAAVLPIHQRTPSQCTEVEVKRPPQAVIPRCQVEIMQKKRKWAPRTLMLLEEVKLFVWSTAEQVMDNGITHEFAERTNLQRAEWARESARRKTCSGSSARRVSSSSHFRPTQSISNGRL